MLSSTKSYKAGKTFLQTLFFFLLVTQICFSQWQDITDTIPKQINDVVPLRPLHTTHTPGLTPVSLHPSFYDRKAEWQWIIDSTWGQGESLSGKLTTFDIYQVYARTYNSTFLWNPINWDSLAVVLRSRINDSTSRGGFARILNNLVFGLNDAHAYAFDNIVLNTPLNPGTPILADGGGYINHFGAGLTPLADSSLLVYKVVPNHPLGLVPGDIILGYEGVPWSQIVRELLAGGVPHTLFIGGSQSSTNRVLLWAAGESWHMFDTIDVVKYATGLIEHLPLDPMVNLVPPGNYINNEQLPIPGVPMPIYNQNSGAVTYGIIEGTNIGYIYVYHEGYSNISPEFDAAVLALMETDGLIIDIRLNWGGGYGLNDGISRLINHATYTMDIKIRCSPTDLYSLCPSYPSFWIGEIPADVGTFYDKPIAVLLGPNCLSYGDVTSWQLSYVPNARMFGRSPMAIFSGMWSPSQPFRPGYSLRCPNLTLVDHYQPDIPRWGQEYPNLEEVWLTPEGVANGEDDVVNRAVEWMDNLVYPHNIVTDKTYYTPEADSVHICTTIENPNSHQLTARAYLNTVEGTLIDSVDLVKQTIKTDGEEWIANLNLPSTEEFYKIGVTVFDETASDEYKVSNATRFTTAGPLILDSIAYLKGLYNWYNIRSFVKNDGTSLTITNAKIRFICDDPWVSSIGQSLQNLPDIAPGETVGSVSSAVFGYIDSLFPGYFNIKVELISDYWVFWSDSIQLIVTGVEDLYPQPLTFNLEQNYPNPFNPSTTFRYSIPQTSKVVIKVYDILGNEVATLMDEEKSVSTYELKWNAENLPSGVYFYQLKAGEFISTKKMILLK